MLLALLQLVWARSDWKATSTDTDSDGRKLSFMWSTVTEDDQPYISGTLEFQNSDVSMPNTKDTTQFRMCIAIQDPSVPAGDAKEGYIETLVLTWPDYSAGWTKENLKAYSLWRKIDATVTQEEIKLWPDGRDYKFNADVPTQQVKNWC